MTEPTPAPDTAPEAPAADDANDTGSDLNPEQLRKALEKARKEAANYRTKAKELEPLAAKAKELEDAGRTELEKLTVRAETAEKERGALEARALRLEVAFDKGLTPAQAKRLVGATREELEADADEILRDFPAAKPDGRPKGDAGLGPRPSARPSDPRQADLSQIEADLAASRRK